MRDDSLVWSLFLDRESVERQVTALIRRNIALAHGVQISESPAPPARRSTVRNQARGARRKCKASRQQSGC